MATGSVMVDIDGYTLSEDDRELLCHPAVGGVIYFSRNYKSVEQITQLTQQIKAIRSDLLIAVDQEGGRVQRFKDGFTRLPPMQKFLPLYRKNTEAALSLVKNCGWLMAAELIAVGVDFSFAPVLDLDDNRCPVVGDRSFSRDPAEASAIAGAWITGMAEAGMCATGKHFPGHGSVDVDSHLGLPIDPRSLAEIQQHDLIPFQTLLPHLSAVMPAHIVFSAVDDQPVGFSSYWLQTILREQLQFEGVIFSDDLTMEGAGFAGDYPARADAALSAGCDMILVCNNREGAWAVVNSLSANVIGSKDQSDLNLSSNNRLSAMVAKPNWDVAQLNQNPKYHSTRAIISALCPA